MTTTNLEDDTEGNYTYINGIHCSIYYLPNDDKRKIFLVKLFI